MKGLGNIMKKLLCLDLDGTFLNSRKEANPEDLKAVNDMLAKGHSVAFATGRPTLSGILLAKSFGLTGPGFYVIGYNGAEIYDTGEGKSCFRMPFPVEDFSHIREEAYQEGFCCITYDDSHVLTDRGRDDEAFYSYQKDLKLPVKLVEDTARYISENEIPILKMIVATLKGKELLERFREKLLPYTQKKLYALVTSYKLLEIGPGNVSKGTGIRSLSEILDIPLKDTIGVGDESNDIEMLKTVGHPVAMANGAEEVKSLAEYVTERDNDHGGVAEVIGHFTD
ncbi:MAG: Cof-type HAD-IIB family hydrolase [Lachnospiraceae bacterium]|nr:Cof-type HAD-IIB family hydrolase [Lachnospiraceae bacterium]